MEEVFLPDTPLVLVGCGHMGKALALGWLKAGLDPLALYVVDPVASTGALPNVPATQFFKTAKDFPAGLMAKAVLLAVKPQVIMNVMPSVARFTSEDSLVVSVAAGITLNQMKTGVGIDAVYVRAMPNTPAAVGAGITGLTADSTITPVNRALACSLLEATGSTVWIEQEDQMNAVTAVSGSGPAYVFHMVECMAAAGTQLGLDADVAMALARQTVIGAGQLMMSDDDVDAGELRRRVTSPGGTTAAALNVLMADNDLEDLMKKAIKAANHRGQELSG